MARSSKFVFLLIFSLLIPLAESGALSFEANNKELISLVRALRAQSWSKHGGIEILTGGPSAVVGQSRWGHVALRFVGSGQSPLRDKAVEALALNTPEETATSVVKKGLTGGFPAVFHTSNLRTIMQRYYADEQRGYARTILPSTEEQRARLLDVLETYASAREMDDRYYFIGMNCADFMAVALGKAGFFQIERTSAFIPLLFSQHLRRSFLNPWPDLKSLPGGILSELSPDAENLTIERARAMSTLQLQRFMLILEKKSINSEAVAIAELQRRKDKVPTEEVYGLSSVPPSLYQSGAEISPAALAVFEPETLSFQMMQNRAVMTSTYVGAFCRDERRAQCDYFFKAARSLR